MAWLVPALLAIASLGKIVAFEEFVASVAEFTLVPMWVRTLAGLLVPGVEFVPVVLLVIGRPRLANVTCILLLAVFSGIVYWQYGLIDPPNCSCLGEWMRYEWAQDLSSGVLVRNAVLVGIALVAVAALWIEARHRGDAG